MGRRRILKQSIRKLGRIGSDKNHSYYLTVPMSFVRDLGWHEGQTLLVKRVGKKIHVTNHNQY